MENYWKKAAFGAIPYVSPNTSNRNIGYETEQNGSRSRLYMVRCGYNSGTHPGKIKEGWGGANISWGGQEISNIKNYEIYTGPNPSYRSVTLNPGQNFIPNTNDTAIGSENASPLYAIRARMINGIHIGKVANGWPFGLIPFGGNEVEVSQFEVIQLNQSLPILKIFLLVGDDGLREQSSLKANIKFFNNLDALSFTLRSSGQILESNISKTFINYINHRTRIIKLEDLHKFELQFDTGSTGQWFEEGDDLDILKIQVDFISSEGIETTIYTSKNPIRFENNGIHEAWF
jgi:hypothetical protein